MYDKKQINAMLRDELNSWEELLAGLSEEQITAPDLPSDWSIKDVIAHLWGWQQRTVARMEAALLDKAPNYPSWPAALDPNLEEDVDRTNAWIYETNREKPWPVVYGDWRAQFLHLLELTEQIPEKELLDPGRYAWMDGYPLSESHMGTYEHHKEHLETLQEFLSSNGNGNRR